MINVTKSYLPPLEDYVKYLERLWASGRLTGINMTSFLSSYVIFAGLIFIPLAAYVVFIEKIMWKRVALLVFSMLLLPQLSGDYKLIHIYLPMFLFILSIDSSRLDILYLGMFGLLMIPKDHAYLPNVYSEALNPDISISVMINILLILLMATLIVYEGLKAPLHAWFEHASAQSTA